jgi:acetyl-CoA carboxylase biotin carboxyl carrier protein
MIARLEGRQSGRHDTAGVREATGDDEGTVEVLSPGVGVWRPQALPGHVVVAGDILGDLEVLGATIRVIAPAGARGAVLESVGAGRARTPVSWGQRLYRLDPRAGAVDATIATAASAAATAGLVFTAPTSGRFYSKSGPQKPPFVAAGDVVSEGQTVCLLEVMKTFNRVTYGGAGLPTRARVKAVLVADEADVAQGDPILALEAEP